MIKKCLNCKIEYSRTLIKRQFCDAVCVKAYKKKWLNSLYRNQGEFLRELVEKDLQSNY